MVVLTVFIGSFVAFFGVNLEFKVLRLGDGSDDVDEDRILLRGVVASTERPRDDGEVCFIQEIHYSSRYFFQKKKRPFRKLHTLFEKNEKKKGKENLDFVASSDEIRKKRRA